MLAIRRSKNSLFSMALNFHYQTRVERQLSTLSTGPPPPAPIAPRASESPKPPGWNGQPRRHGSSRFNVHNHNQELVKLPQIKGELITNKLIWSVDLQIPSDWLNFERVFVEDIYIYLLLQVMITLLINCTIGTFIFTCIERFKKNINKYYFLLLLYLCVYAKIVLNFN